MLDLLGSVDPKSLLAVPTLKCGVCFKHPKSKNKSHSHNPL